ncbi:MAG: aldo/keto reductase [Pseudomonadota bacterium]
MQYRQLGKNGPKVRAIGFGAMSIAGFFGPADEATSLKCLEAAFEEGLDHIDTADLYGMGLSERLVGQFLAAHKPKAVIATKGSIRIKPVRKFDNSKAYLTEALDASLDRLGVDYVDLYYIHRREADRPIEEVVETLSGFIKEGKIGGYGLSEVSPTTLRRAHAIHPCMAVQNEYSLWSRQPDLGLIRTCEELGTAFVAFSPVARGMLTDSPPDPTQMGDSDFRKRIPRFTEPNFSDNQRIVQKFREWCHTKGHTTEAVSIAWCLARSPSIIPIPGTRTADHLRKWSQADQVTLSAEDMAGIDHLLPVGWAYGDRYDEGQSVGPERYC